MNEYFLQNLKNRLHLFSAEEQENLVKEAEFLSDLGVQSAEDHKVLFYLKRFAKDILTELSENSLSTQDLNNSIQYLFQNRDEYPIDTIYNLYRAAAYCLQKNNLTIKKTAYLHSPGGFQREPEFSREKWMKALREIYTYSQQHGVELSSVFNAYTANWDHMEKLNFKRWSSFYQEGAHEKYKTAQFFGPTSGVTVPINNLKSQVPGLPVYTPTEEERIQKKIKSLLSRLNAAEKLATDSEVQRYLSKRLDISLQDWLAELHKIKRLIITTPIKNIKSSILEDLIIRHANMLALKGFTKTANELAKFAQEVPPEMPMELPPVDPNAMPAEPIESEEESGKKVINKLIEGLNFDSDDVSDVEDEEIDKLAEINIVAQVVPTPEIVQEVPLMAEPSAEIEVEAPVEKSADPDQLIEAALGKCTVQDVIDDLEAIANIYRTREMTRRLALVDLKLNALEMSSFFPALGEVSNKNFESNQYSLIRVEEVLSKLRGAIETVESKNLKNELKKDERNIENIPSRSPIQKELIHERKVEQEKEDKKHRDIQKVTKPTVTNVEQDLAQPAQLTSVKPGPTANTL